MILKQPLERGPPGRPQRDSWAASGALRGLDSRCVCGPWVGLAQESGSFGWWPRLVCRVTRSGAGESAWA